MTEKPTLEQIVWEQLHEVNALIAHGKGEWPKPGYVRDDVWHGWLDRRDVLSLCLRKAGLLKRASND